MLTLINTETMKFTIDEIINAWYACYGENLPVEYDGFLTYLINMRSSHEN